MLTHTQSHASVKQSRNSSRNTICHMPHATCHFHLSFRLCVWQAAIGRAFWVSFFSLDFGISRCSVCRGCWRCVRGQRSGVLLLLIMRLVLCYTFFTQLLFPHIAAMAASHGAARRGVIQRHVLTPPEIAHVWACPSGLCVCAYECVCLSPLMSSATWPLLKQAGRTKNKLKGTRHKAQGSSQRGRGTLRAHSALKSFLCFHPGLLLFLASLYTLQAMR